MSLKTNCDFEVIYATAVETHQEIPSEAEQI